MEPVRSDEHALESSGLVKPNTCFEPNITPEQPAETHSRPGRALPVI